MNQIQKNKAFILHYYNTVSGVLKTPELLSQFIDDPILIECITFFDGAFPRYHMSADEMTAEGNRVVVRATMQGIHEGTYAGIMPTYRKVEFPVIVSYEIENDRIVTHWLVGDQMTIMEQLGVDMVVGDPCLV